MAFSTDFRNLERLADIVGFSEAISLSAFFARQGARTYIPTEATPDHVICRVIGMPAFRDLVEAFGGQYVAFPPLDLKPLKTAGAVFRMHRRGVSAIDIASTLELNPRTISGIKRQLRLEGLRDLAEILPDDEAA